MFKVIQAQIRSTGRYLPKKVISSEDLEVRLGLEVGYIAARNGVQSRHVADPASGETTVQMGVWAAQDALERAQVSADELDLILFASAGPEQAIPDTAPLIQAALGLGQSGISCFSVHSTCLSFLSALDVASCFIACERYRNILIVCCELSSLGMNPADPKTFTLFGDGAAAALITPTPQGEQSAILRSHISTFGDAARFTEVKGCGTAKHPNLPHTCFEDNTFHMDGREVLKVSLREAPTVLEKIWPGLSKSCSDFDWIVPHQPSLIGMRALSRFFEPSKTIETLSNYGNCVSVSLPLSLDEGLRSGQLQRGQQILLFGTGAGLSMAGISLIL